ncbi:arginine methyltransferas-like protein [Hyphopichia burtonii NRRL Y-1933]|uniref:Arginine N-methyltransferase 2 n=1 Tax=Hyphopichia burtonii NRRL Y-1933 TaxID=984485 RepID=A0A1E4RDE4_9ASCO|nr:arginine methyltransferas-like protein [Hyphopichia burtonii NRRL Y-1933]ODV65270.1 arginine methyltransferas-like protein [Hyphopichia burtonii NRRL Y-1933]
MSDLHDLCKFGSRPVKREYVDQLKHYLKAGIPSTYTVEQAYKYTNNIEDDEESSNTTPLHLIASFMPGDASSEELEVIDEMVTILFEYGAGWCFTDINNETPGCILIRRNLKNTPIYQQIVDAGVRAELLLRKVSEFDMEVIEDTDDLNHEQFLSVKIEEDEKKDDEDEKKDDEDEKKDDEDEKKEEEDEETEEKEQDVKVNDPSDPAYNQAAYLETKLEYRDDALITKDAKDGVMMSWETNLMQKGCDTLFQKGSYIEPNELDSEINVLNIGFGMGIIDSMIQKEKPTKHYICEAHPDVLAKLKRDGWYEKPNVVILEGRWQDKLSDLLSSGSIFFNGIYYDTYSEHYQDMLELFDCIVGLLKPHGVFSFFNGLGADRQVIYEVYKKLVELDLSNYGLNCKFTEVNVPDSQLKESSDKSVWDDVKRSYWSCPIYYHPEVKFIDY